jgi:phosphatidylglycerol:prolipoprotein diacylglycerol transferase
MRRTCDQIRMERRRMVSFPHAQEVRVTNAYPMVFTLGVLLGLLWLGLSSSTNRNSNRRNSRTDLGIVRLDAGLATLAGGLIGARASFVLIHWDYYAGNPAEIFWFWQGGLTWVGGAAGALLGLGLYAAHGRYAFWPLMDKLVLPGAMIAVSAWTGCLLDGCAFGRPTGASLWTSPTEDMFASSANRWPTQTVGVLYSLLVVAVLYWLSNRGMRDGALGFLGLTMIAAGALALSFTRSDPALLVMGFRLDTIGSAAVLIVASSGLLLRSIEG